MMSVEVFAGHEFLRSEVAAYSANHQNHWSLVPSGTLQDGSVQLII
jgi:hypothetical protein